MPGAASYDDRENESLFQFFLRLTDSFDAGMFGGYTGKIKAPVVPIPTEIEVHRIPREELAAAQHSSFGKKNLA
eukprot:scaffold659_cov192-Ochromonas_danica.AAC.2